MSLTAPIRGAREAKPAPRFAFPREVRTADDSRVVLIEMLKQARGQS